MCLQLRLSCHISWESAKGSSLPLFFCTLRSMKHNALIKVLSREIMLLLCLNSGAGSLLRSKAKSLSQEERPAPLSLWPISTAQVHLGMIPLDPLRPHELKKLSSSRTICCFHYLEFFLSVFQRTNYFSLSSFNQYTTLSMRPILPALCKIAPTLLIPHSPA